MITSFFNKSKPINLIIAIVILIFSSGFKLFYWYYNSNTINILNSILCLLLSIISVFIVDFITKKNNLSNQTDYTLLWYCVLFFFNISEFNFYLLLSHIFILLSIRKIISLKSQKDITKKIFDASLWIFIATLFHFWSITYLGILFLGILFYAPNYYKHWLIPFTSLFLVFITTFSSGLVFYNNGFHFYNTNYLFDLNSLNTEYFKAVIFILILLILSSIIFIKHSLHHKTKNDKNAIFLIFIMILISSLIVYLSPSKSYNLVIFYFFPISIFSGILFENIQKEWIKNIIIIFSLLIPFSILFLTL